ncbi:MAG: AAA family ATPase [Thermoleophilia bacterium]
MAETVRTLVAADRGVDMHELANLVRSDTVINVVGVVDGIDEARRTLEDSSCDVLVVACQGYSEAALSLIDGAIKQDADRPVLVLAREAPSGFVRSIFEAGADDILMLPQTPDAVRFSIQKLLARKSQKTSRRKGGLGRLICVLGPKGGAGKTLVSANLAVALAEAGQNVAIVDLDLQFGDVGLCLGLGPERTFYDLALAGGTLDSQKLEAYLTPHSSGVHVLLAPIRPDQASSVSVELIRDVYSFLRSTFDAVIVDTPPGFTAEVIATIDASTDIVIVGMLDAASLKNTKLGLETLELMGCDPQTIRMVLNRAQSQVGITQADAAKVLGRQPDIFIPSDREIPRAVNEGMPILITKPMSEAAAAFRQLASLIIDSDVATLAAGQDEMPAAQGRRRIFGRNN